jgi:hypothetical protein
MDGPTQSKGESEKFNKENYVFLVEKLASRIPLPYPLTFIVLVSTILCVEAVLYFSVNVFDYGSIFQYSMWNLPGGISIVLCMVFSRYLRDKTIQHFNRMISVLKDEEIPTLKRQIDITFAKAHHWLIPLVASFFVAVPFQTYFLIIAPWPQWQPWYEQWYFGALALGIISTLFTWLWLFAVGTLGYFCICSAAILHRVRNRLKPLSIAEIDKGYVKPLGSQLMTITTSFAFGVGVNLMIGVVAPIAWWSVAQVLVFVASMLVLFFVPLFDLHRVMSDEKEKALRSFKEKWWDVSAKARPAMINALRVEEQRIEEIATWPFSGDMLLRVGGYVIIPVVLFVLRYLLE